LDEKIAHVAKKIKSIQANGTIVKDTYDAQLRSVSQQQADLVQLEKAAAQFEKEAKIQEEARGVTLNQEDMATYSSLYVALLQFKIGKSGLWKEGNEYGTNNIVLSISLQLGRRRSLCGRLLRPSSSAS